jgi:hypothetical protein
MMKDTKKTYRNSRKRKRTKRPWQLLLVLSGLILVAVGIFSTGRKDETPRVPIEVKGQPNLKVDQELVDFGEVKFEQPVYATFTLTNTGDQTLHFNEQPYIEVLEGC